MSALCLGYIYIYTSNKTEFKVKTFFLAINTTPLTTLRYENYEIFNAQTTRVHDKRTKYYLLNSKNVRNVRIETTWADTNWH